MSFKKVLSLFFRKHVFNPEWQCVCCGAENFDGGYFCKDCLKTLSFNDKAICDHCGRKVIESEAYCSTCKEHMTSVDKARSVFNYQQPVSGLIQNLKYKNNRYLAEVFGDYLYVIYLKNYFNADYLCYVPMTKKAERKRGYNQSQLLAKGLSIKTGVPIGEFIIKAKETERQAKLNRKERLKNLNGAFKVTDKKSVKDKTILIVDDVSTTGSTAQAIAEKLKKAGAKTVYLLTVASTPPLDNY